ncbi:hypothetical protein SIN01_13700 [Sporolactobacillus inulinus]|nr:hypothetical protein SIN01_13700 [Sporolactobacillus inulinus]
MLSDDYLVWSDSMETVSELLQRLEYLQHFNREERIWMGTMVSFMRRHLPNWQETTFCCMPAYRNGHHYIAFYASRGSFAFYINDSGEWLHLKEQLSHAAFGKRSVRVPLENTAVIPVFFDACRSVSRRVNRIKKRAQSTNFLKNDSVAKKLLR